MFYFFYFLVLLPWGSFIQEEMETAEFFMWVTQTWVNYPFLFVKDFLRYNHRIFGD